MGDNTSYYNNRISTNNNEYNENTKNNELTTEKTNNLEQNDIDNNNINDSKEIKEESSNTFSSHKEEKKLKSINKNNLFDKNDNSNEKENKDINGSKNNNIENKHKNIRTQFLEKFKNDSKQKDIYNLVNTKRGNETDPNIDGLEDFNDLIYGKKNLSVNIKYNTIQINQIQKTIPILLSDEAFNRKMKEYQTEIFRRKKELEINDIENRMNKNGTNVKINVNNSQELNLNSNKYIHTDGILSSDKKNGINDFKKENESNNNNNDENKQIKDINNSSLFKKEENNININYKKDNNNTEDENDNNIEENDEEKIYIENKTDNNNNLEKEALKTIEYNLDKEKNKIQGTDENIKNDIIINEDIIIEQNNQETIPDIDNNKILKENSSEAKSKDENNNLPQEKESKEKIGDNEIIIKELEKIEEQDEEQNEDQKEEIKETIEISQKKEEDKKEISSTNKSKEIVKEIIIEQQEKEKSEQKPEEIKKTKDNTNKDDIMEKTEIIITEEKKEEPKIIKENNDSPKYEKKFGDINNIMKDPEKENKLRTRLNARMKLLKGKGKDNNNKFTPVRKSEFIGLQAMLLQQQMGMKPMNNSSMEKNSANSSFSEKVENKEKRLTVNDILNNIPVSQKKKKSKIIFFDE